MKRVIQYFCLALLLMSSCAKEGNEARFYFQMNESGRIAKWDGIDEIRIEVDLFYEGRAWQRVEDGGKAEWFLPIYKETGRFVREAEGWTLYRDSDSGSEKVDYLAVFAAGLGHHIAVDMYFESARLTLVYPANPGDNVVDPDLVYREQIQQEE